MIQSVEVLNVETIVARVQLLLNLRRKRFAKRWTNSISPELQMFGGETTEYRKETIVVQIQSRWSRDPLNFWRNYGQLHWKYGQLYQYYGQLCQLEI